MYSAADSTGATRLLCLAVMGALFTGCEPDPDRVEVQAVIASYREAEAQGLPPEVREASPRYITPVWQNTSDSLPSGIGQALGLETLPSNPVFSDPPSFVLNSYEPVVHSIDSVEVVLEFLVVNSVTFHGPDFVFLLDCRRRCEVIRTLGRGYLN